MSAEVDVLVVGAGVAGLSCARVLAAAGRSVRVVDRARGVGGRCATRRLEGMAFDLGPSFLHGRRPDFVAALREVPGRRIDGWPRSVQGAGRPCQPEAFVPGEERLVHAEGVNAFPRHLARGLDVRLEAPVERIALDGGRPRGLLAGGEAIGAEALVLALAPEQVLRLLDGAGALPRSVASIRALLASDGSEAALALCAAYRPEVAPPPWDVLYPDASRVLQVASHESGKRDAPPFVGLVLQARPSWSHQHLDDPDWPRLLLEEAGRVVGPWAATPAAMHPHRWRFARTPAAAELAGPVLVRLPDGGRLAVCGDRFAPGGGVEAAWISGRELGRRLAAPEGT